MTLRKIVFFALALALCLPFSAEFFCKRYDFGPEKYVKLNQKVGDLEVMDLKFELPNQDYQQNRCTLTVKNYGSRTLKANFALALFDESGNLVACGTTGTKLSGTRAGHTETFYVSFDYVRTKIRDTKFFYLTAETAPQ
jgi:hypothetical protein